MARKYAHRIPFILKFNHNELLTYPNTFDQILFAQVQNAWEMGCAPCAGNNHFDAIVNILNYF